MLCLLLLLLLGPAPSAPKIVGITIDVEGHIQDGGAAAAEVLDALTNATGMLRAAPELGLRFSAAVQVSWAFHPVTFPAGTGARPGHEAVMDIIDEAIVMAYYNGCNDPLSVPSAPCDIAPTPSLVVRASCTPTRHAS